MGLQRVCDEDRRREQGDPSKCSRRAAENGLQRAARAKEDQGEEVDEDPIEHMNEDVYEVIAGDVVVAEVIIQRKADVGDRPGLGDALETCPVQAF